MKKLVLTLTLAGLTTFAIGCRPGPDAGADPGVPDSPPSADSHDHDHDMVRIRPKARIMVH